jgi:hypothetical protein
LHLEGVQLNTAVKQKLGQEASTLPYSSPFIVAQLGFIVTQLGFIVPQVYSDGLIRVEFVYIIYSLSSEQRYLQNVTG